MFQSNYYIKKKSGFYQDTLALYGLARLIDLIINSRRKEKYEILLIDRGQFYEISIEDYSITEKDVSDFCLKPQIGFDYIFQESKNGTKKPIHPDSKEELHISILDIQKEWEKLKNKNNENSENIKAVNPDFSIYALLSHFSIEFIKKEHAAGTKQGGMFTRTYLQLFLNNEHFERFVNALLFYFSTPKNKEIKEFNKLAFPMKNDMGEKIEYITLSKSHKINNTTYNQLISPVSSKGINSNKPKLSELKDKPNLLLEYLKILGCFESMFSIGGSADFEDYRIYVCEPKEIQLSLQRTILKSFKKAFFSNSSIKADIFSMLLYAKEIINHSKSLGEDFHFSFNDIYSPKNYVNGFYVCHFMTIKKSLPKKHAPINLAYLSIPKFIQAQTTIEANNWLDIIEELITVSRSIKGSQKNEESGDAIKGLNYLRNFISSSNVEVFLEFQYWYAKYLMFAFNKKQQDPKWFVKTFNVKTLDLIFKDKDMNEFKITDITSNEGFQKVAYAIRKSTVTLQYTPKEQRKFEIRYGLAQTLQNKSKSTPDLAEFIGEFVATYNAETARYAEKNGSVMRSNVKEDELSQFYELLDKFPSKVVGALLASYGFALTKKETDNTSSDNQDNETEAN